jgi:hypothetical protein
MVSLVRFISAFTLVRDGVSSTGSCHGLMVLRRLYDGFSRQTQTSSAMEYDTIAQPKHWSQRMKKTLVKFFRMMQLLRASG